MPTLASNPTTTDLTNGTNPLLHAVRPATPLLTLTHRDVCILRDMFNPSTDVAPVRTILRLAEQHNHGDFPGSFSYYCPPTVTPTQEPQDPQDSPIQARLPFGLNPETHPDITRLYNQATALLAEYPPTTTLHDQMRTQYFRALYIMGGDQPPAWLRDHIQSTPLHPAIDALLYIDSLATYITDMSLLVMEHPHESQTDPTRIAYTQSVQKGERELYTVTSISKYIKRHCPDMPDHELRDFCAKQVLDESAYAMITNSDEMIISVRNGPKSCMSDAFRDLDEHPYAVYAPQFGWSMAVRYGEGKAIHGRCLCLEHDGCKLFIRSYKHAEGGGYSYDDPKLEAWLYTQGYTKEDCWPDGAELKLIYQNGRVVMPYIDKSGSVRISGDRAFIDDDGDEASNTDGYLHQDNDDYTDCDDCGESTENDDLTAVYGGNNVCSCCLNNEYVECETRYGAEHVHVDSATWVEWNGTYYYTDDIDRCFHDLVCTEDEGYTHVDNAWQCEESRIWYSSDIDYVQIGDAFYHPDHAPEIDEEEEATQEEVEVTTVPTVTQEEPALTT